MEKNPLEKLAAIKNNDYIEYLKEKVEDIKALEDDEWATLEKADFEKYILPFLIGKVERNEQNISAFLTNVLTVTDSYYRGIKIVDNGKPFLYYPPLLLNIKHDSELLENVAFSRIVKEYKSLIGDPFGRDETFLSGIKAGLESVIEPDYEKVKDYLEKLKELYEYYGITTNYKNKPDAKKIEQQADDDLGDLIDYD